MLATILYTLSTSYVGNTLLKPFESPYNHKLIKTDVDAVVILSGGHNEYQNNLPLSPSAFKRAMYGVMIAKNMNLPIVFSGAGLKKYTESDAMRSTVKQLNSYLNINLLETNFIKKDSFTITYEQKSLNTFENAKFTKKRFDDLNITKPKIYLVTSAFHMRRSEKLYRYFGFDVIPAATDFKTTYNHYTNSYFPSMGGLAMTYYALHEYAGIALLSLKLK